MADKEVGFKLWKIIEFFSYVTNFMSIDFCVDLIAGELMSL